MFHFYKYKFPGISFGIQLGCQTKELFTNRQVYLTINFICWTFDFTFGHLDMGE